MKQILVILFLLNLLSCGKNQQQPPQKYLSEAQTQLDSDGDGVDDAKEKVEGSHPYIADFENYLTPIKKIQLNFTNEEIKMVKVLEKGHHLAQLIELIKEPNQSVLNSLNTFSYEFNFSEFLDYQNYLKSSPSFEGIQLKVSYQSSEDNKPYVASIQAEDYQFSIPLFHEADPELGHYDNIIHGHMLKGQQSLKWKVAVDFNIKNDKKTFKKLTKSIQEKTYRIIIAKEDNQEVYHVSPKLPLSKFIQTQFSSFTKICREKLIQDEDLFSPHPCWFLIGCTSLLECSPKVGSTVAFVQLNHQEKVSYSGKVINKDFVLDRLKGSSYTVKKKKNAQVELTVNFQPTYIRHTQRKRVDPYGNLDPEGPRYKNFFNGQESLFEWPFSLDEQLGYLKFKIANKWYTPSELLNSESLEVIDYSLSPLGPIFKIRIRATQDKVVVGTKGLEHKEKVYMGVQDKAGKWIEKRWQQKMVPRFNNFKIKVQSKTYL